MRSADHRLDAGEYGFRQFGNSDSIQEARCRAAQAEEVGALVLQDLFDVVERVRLGVAVHDRGFESLLVQPRGKTGQPDRRHDVGEAGDVTACGIRPITERVNECNSGYHSDGSYSL